MARAVVAAVITVLFAAYCAAQGPASSPDTEGPSEPPSQSAPESTSPAPAPSGPAEQKAPARPERIYKVWIWQETRDCLWNLAERYYGDPWQWKRIYLANQAQIADPRVIYPKQELIIPYPDEPER